MDDGGVPQPPEQLLVHDSDLLFDKQYSGQQTLSTRVQAPHELGSAEGYAGWVAVAAGKEVLVVYFDVPAAPPPAVAVVLGPVPPAVVVLEERVELEPDPDPGTYDNNDPLSAAPKVLWLERTDLGPGNALRIVWVQN